MEFDLKKVANEDELGLLFSEKNESKTSKLQRLQSSNVRTTISKDVVEVALFTEMLHMSGTLAKARLLPMIMQFLWMLHSELLSNHKYRASKVHYNLDYPYYRCLGQRRSLHSKKSLWDIAETEA